MNPIIQENIVAIATAPGEGGIGIIRLSGPEAEKFLRLFFHPTSNVTFMSSHRLYHGRFVDSDNSDIDEVMAVIMRKPHSYTREDVVEIHCHGGVVVQSRILHLLIDAGVRLARPGEFTLRAFLNGRIDLARAEAVIDVIRSRSEAAHTVAMGQLNGKLSRLIFEYRTILADLLVEIEAGIDFPEEDIELSEQDNLYRRGNDLVQRMKELVETFEGGRVLKEGLSILIFGKPNVGKSSLMNCLLGEARAIVTEIPGTTRDTIEESLVLGGIPLRLVDTAGVRETDDPVEVEGVRRAHKKVAGSDLVLLVIDGSCPVSQDDLLALNACHGRHVLLVVNKADLGFVPLGEPFTDLPFVSISAVDGYGLAEIKEYIHRSFGQGSGRDARESVIISDARHREALVKGMGALERFLVGINRGLAGEFLALELREALDSLGEITGETTPGEILDKIFTRFCVGK
jgi:tRNA modification GTPase